jgi:hypothetical protein
VTATPPDPPPLFDLLLAEVMQTHPEIADVICINGDSQGELTATIVFESYICLLLGISSDPVRITLLSLPDLSDLSDLSEYFDLSDLLPEFGGVDINGEFGENSFSGVVNVGGIRVAAVTAEWSEEVAEIAA